MDTRAYFTYAKGARLIYSDSDVCKYAALDSPLSADVGEFVTFSPRY